MDVQRAIINPRQLKSFTSPITQPYRHTGQKLSAKISQALQLLSRSHRPVLLVGGGVRLANAVAATHQLAQKLQIPIICTWSGFDVFPFDHPLFIGQMGVYGNRGANFTVQNADLLLSLGSRLDTRITGGKPQTYARIAQKIIVDIDYHEIYKHRGLEPDIAINTDLREFLIEFSRQFKPSHLPDTNLWLTQTRQWKKQYPGVLPQWRKRKTKVDPYVFIDALSDELTGGETIIADCGANLTWTMQAFRIKNHQRLFSTFGNSPMGYALPASIGASIALNKRPVICITGDGGLQINIQELQTIMAYKLPIKIFILNNHSYGIIKQFQDMYFDSRHEASDPAHGVTVPDFIKVGQAYGLNTISIRNHQELHPKLRQILNSKTAVLCDVIIPDNATLIPKLEFGKPIEDLSPLLPRQEFLSHMLKESK